MSTRLVVNWCLASRSCLTICLIVILADVGFPQSAESDGKNEPSSSISNANSESSESHLSDDRVGQSNAERMEVSFESQRPANEATNDRRMISRSPLKFCSRT